MSWFISIVLASSLFAAGNIPISDKYLNENRNSQSINTLDETERFEQSYPLNPNGRISVSNVNGSITIEGWERNEVKLEVTKTADSRESLSDIQVKIDSSPDQFDVETDFGNWNRRGNQNWDNQHRKVEVQYRLSVPRAAVLNEIETVNGSVSVNNLTNYIKASAVNGAVNGLNLRGTADLSTVNGSVTGDFEELQGGSIISLNTVNGSANLIIPSDANATIRAESVNGTITNDFGLPIRKGKYVGRDLYGKIGSGDVKIKLESVNGGLMIKRKNDGKTPNPVINLLPPKSSDDDDDDDFDDDFDSNFDASMQNTRRKLERDMERYRRVIEKTSVASSKEALEAARASAEVSEVMIAEIIKIEPQIARIDAEALRETAAAIELAGKRLNIEEAELQAKVALTQLAEMRSMKTPYLEEKSGSYPINGVSSIRIETLNCSVSIRGWDRSEVKYSMSKVASNGYQIPIEFKAVQNDSGAVEIKVVNKNVWTVSKSTKLEPTRVRLEVFVPQKSNLKIVTNDEVRLEGVSGEIDLEGQNGAINVRDSDGKLNLKAEDGLVRVIGFTGEFESETADGEMFLEGDFQKIYARVKNGTIVLTLPEKTNADIKANTGSVAAEGIDLIPQINNSDEFDNQWRIGKGGRDFNFNMAEGNVIIRSLSDIKTS